MVEAERRRVAKADVNFMVNGLVFVRGGRCGGSRGLGERKVETERRGFCTVLEGLQCVTRIPIWTSGTNAVK